MSKIRYALSIIASGVCICLSMEACTNQVLTPTQTKVSVNPQTIEATTPPIPTLTFTPTLSPDQLATRETPDPIIATMDAEMAILPNCGLPLSHDYSPDGNWVAIECLENGIGVYNSKDFSKSWYFSYYDTFGLKYENGNHFGRLKPKHWSADGKYLYFVSFLGGDGGCVYYAEGQALFRLDLSSGKYSEILSPAENLPYYNFSFSNDDRYLGYFETWREHPSLNVYELKSNVQQEIPLSETYSGAGYLIWSPDSSKVLFSARSGDECENMIYYLVLLNLENRSQKIVFESDTIKYFPVQWIDENLILIEAGFSEEYYSMDIVTGEIMPYNQLTPTPKP